MIAAIVAGGRASRLGGAPKWLMPTRDGRTIVARLADECRAAGLSPVVVSNRSLFGPDLPRIVDAADDRGPLAAVVAALAHASPDAVVIVAGDLPRVSARLLARLAAAEGASVAPRAGGHYEPLFARLAPDALGPARARLARGDLSLQALYRELAVGQLPLSDDDWAELDDVDDVADVAAL